MNKIKIFGLAALLLVPATNLLAEPPEAVSPRAVDTIDPTILGILPFAFEGTPSKDQVLVIRCRISSSDPTYQTRTTEMIFGTSGTPIRQKITVFEPSKFPFRPRLHGDEEQAWLQSPSSQAIVTYFTSEETLPVGMHEGTTLLSPRGLSVVFFDSRDEKKRLEYLFSCHVEDLTAVQTRHPKLSVPKPPEAATEFRWAWGPEHTE